MLFNTREQLLEHINLKVPEYHRKVFFDMLEAKKLGVISEAQQKFKELPVDIETFIEGKNYLNKGKVLYPNILKELVALNTGDYTEAVITGAIGCGKTTIALYTTAYNLYLLSCMRSPHTWFDLDPSSEIILVFQSITEKLAKQVDYARFKSMIESAPYFINYFSFDHNIQSKLVFPGRIEVIPIAGTGIGAIGQNVIGGCIDELNFMSVVERSRLSVDKGSYDQAVELYTSIARRRKTRFMNKGRLPGILCLVSSKRYPGQFTDVKILERNAEIDKYGSSTIYVYDKRTWDVLPKSRFLGDWFKLFVGDVSRKPRVVGSDEAEFIRSNSKLVIDIPIEYRSDFEADIINSLRDIAGISTLAKHPFLIDVEKVSECFIEDKKSVLSRVSTDFSTVGLSIVPSRFIKPGLPRWCHIDLALTGDSAGVVVGCVPRFVNVCRGAGIAERLPFIEIDFSLEISPPVGGEIIFEKIRTLLYKIRKEGLNIKWVSLDSFQSVDTIQLLRRQGFMTGKQSIDEKTLPYDVLKSAIYDNRLKISKHAKLQMELLSLEKDVKAKKINHPVGGSKDISDSLAGVVYGLTMRREIWTSFGVSLFDIPSSVREVVVSAKNMKESIDSDGVGIGVLK